MTPRRMPVAGARRSRPWALLAIPCLSTLLPLPQATAENFGTVTPFSDAKLVQDSDVACLKSALESGDPDHGPSTFLLVATPGCEVPPHFHSAGEQLIVVRGEVRAGMDGMRTTALKAGGFAEMPGRVTHWFSCSSRSPCAMFVVFDKAYDITWVKQPK